MEFEQVLESLTFKHVAALKKQIQSLVNCVLSHCLWTYEI